MLPFCPLEVQPELEGGRENTVNNRLIVTESTRTSHLFTLVVAAEVVVVDNEAQRRACPSLITGLEAVLP